MLHVPETKRMSELQCMWSLRRAECLSSGDGFLGDELKV